MNLRLSSTRRQNSYRSLQEISFSANIAYAIVYGLLVHIARNNIGLAWGGRADSAGYYFLRGSFRINDLLHTSSWGVVSTDAVARRLPNQLERIGEDLTVLLTVFGLAAILLLLTRITAGSSLRRILLRRVAGITALFAVPTCFFCALRPTGLPETLPSWLWGNVLFEAFSGNVLLTAFVAEIACLAALFIVRRYISYWAIGILLALHYAMWLVVLWPRIPVTFHLLMVPFILVWVFPLSGLVWLLYLKDTGVHGNDEIESRPSGKFTLAAAIAGFVLLLFIWLPARSYSLARARDLDTILIQVSRGACFGRCPSDTITIHGTGLVEYVSRGNVKVPEQTATISRDQVMQILRALDVVNFFALDDRAFTWCYDTPSIGVSVAIERRYKRVASDTYCTGGKSGVQAEFVAVAKEIEGRVGSEKWAK